VTGVTSATAVPAISLIVLRVPLMLTTLPMDRSEALATVMLVSPAAGDASVVNGNGSDAGADFDSVRMGAAVAVTDTVA
jgi:hypothetical protein